MLEPRAPSQISKFCNNRQNRSIFENVDIRAEDTDVFLYGNPVTWFSEKQSDVSLSSTEAEYKTLTAGFKEAHYFINLMQVEMKIPVTPITSYIDNVAAAIMAEQSVTNKRTKHINLRYHYAREQIKEFNYFDLFYVQTPNNNSDMFTKPLDKGLFEKHRAFIMKLEYKPQQQ